MTERRTRSTASRRARVRKKVSMVKLAKIITVTLKPRLASVLLET